jgi:hypothetical protein
VLGIALRPNGCLRAFDEGFELWDLGFTILLRHAQNAFSTLEATQGEIDGSFSQLPYKCYLEEVASVGD